MGKLLAVLLITLISSFSVLAQKQNFPGSSSSSLLSIDATASTYGLKYNAHYVFDASVTNVQSIVTCNNSSDCNFTSTDILGRPIASTGQIVWGVCGPINFTNIFTSVLRIAQGTILSINGAQSITVSTTASGTCTNNLILVWGDDDTNALLSAWAAAAAICGRLSMPPFAMLTQKGQFNTNPAGSCALPVVTQANFEGVDLKGGGVNSSVVIGTPTFDFTIGSGNSCGGGPTLNWCFFGSTGITVEDFQLWGGGNNLTGVNPASMTYLAGITGGSSSGNAMMTQVHLGGWGAMAGANLRGLIMYNIAINGMSELVSDGFGNIGCVVDQSTTLSTELTLSTGSFCGDNGMVGAANAGTLYILGGTVTSEGNAYGYCNGGAGACSAVYVSGADFGAKFMSHGDHFSNGSGGGSGVGVAVVGVNAEAVIDAANINQQLPSSAATALYAHGGGIIKINNSRLSNGATSGSIFFIDDNLSKIYAGDSNTILSNNASVTNFYNLVAGAELVADSHSFMGFCSGIAPAGTLGFYGTGPNVTALACAATLGNGITMTHAGKVNLLLATATAGGKDATDAVFTLLVNASTTASTATMGTTTFKFDGQHAVSFNSADRLSCQVVTEAATTLANPTCKIVWNAN